MFRLQRGELGSLTATRASAMGLGFVTVIVNLAVPSIRVGRRACVFTSILVMTFVWMVCSLGLLTISMAGCEDATRDRAAPASELTAATTQIAIGSMADSRIVFMARA